MRYKQKILSVLVITLTLLSGCVSQSRQNYGQHFDHIKAAKTRVSLGLTYLKNGNFSQAKFNLDKALEFAPRSAEANFAMAYYYQSVGELEQAENAYQFAMALAPENANIVNSYGAFLCHNGEYEKAKQSFLKAVNTSNYISSAETYENLALCSQRQGLPNDAVQYLRSAVNHQPGRANSLFLLAGALVETQQWQEAKGILTRYEKVSQISPQSLLMAIKIARGTGNDVLAKDYSDMLIRIFPNHPVTKLWLTEAQLFAKMLSKNTKPPVLEKVTKTQAKLLRSQINKNPSRHLMALPEKTDSPTNEKNLNTNKGNIVQNEAVVAKPVKEPTTQVASDILNTPEFHVVAKGENLYRISLLYNIKMQRLIDWNGLVDASAIFNGKKLSLVAPSVVE